MKLMINNVRLSFPVLFEPKQFKGKGDYKFSATFLLPPTHPDYKKILDAIEVEGNAKWKDKWPTIKKTLETKDCIALRDGDNTDYTGYPGNFYLRSSNDVRPSVIDRGRNPVSAQDGVLYSGCYVNASIGIYAQDSHGRRGINCELRGVQFVADGEAFTSSTSADPSEFEDVPGDTENELV
jgi:hypothetical protein